MSRITMADNGITMMQKMAGGNPGALNVLMRIIKDGGKVDPDGIMGGMGTILLLGHF